MKKELSTITFHGFLAKALPKKKWSLNIKSVAEAFRAVNILTKQKLNKALEGNSPSTQRYRVIVNGKALSNSHVDHEKNPSKITESNLNIRRKIETIDVVPVVEGSDFMDVFMTILGIILIVAGIIVGGPWGAAMVMAGLGLLAAGISNLLSKPPDTGDIEETSQSYLFAGPTNVVGEGRAIPLGYGTLRIGTQRVAASFEVTYHSEEVATEIIKSKIC
jgi:predicted phage tail protein